MMCVLNSQIHFYSHWPQHCLVSSLSVFCYQDRCRRAPCSQLHISGFRVLWASLPTFLVPFGFSSGHHRVL